MNPKTIPNYKMFGKSIHGAMFLSQFHEWNLAGEDYFIPTCATCHIGAVFKGVRKSGKPHPALPSVKYPTDGLENRKRAFAVCTQCHNKQWAANSLIGGDLSIGFLDTIRRIAFEVENELERRGLHTPLDRKIVRNIGAMAVRATEIAMFHYAPGYIWWDGVYKAATELVEWLESSVVSRLGVDYVSKYVSWIKELHEKVKTYRKMHGIE